MAPAPSTGQFPGALEVIFTCDICQASVSDIYGKGGAGATETDFQDGRAHTADRRVTCLWLTQCMHLTCGKHLEGGGPGPDKNDEKPKTLYAVRGLRPGNFDPDIPDVLFQFQYLSLIRYSTSVAHKLNELEQERRETELQAKKTASQNAALVTENKELKARLSSLDEDNANIGKWKQRLPKVTHYLKQWPMVVE
ncbi:hypothetical protein SLS55_002354 [Diplodia seriata]|uniref:Mis18 domain-containing protein n=1 Tax=Diplodia seriata TaxID=420778 RepID=A0ABR3CRY8_9PEZI